MELLARQRRSAEAVTAPVDVTASAGRFIRVLFDIDPSDLTRTTAELFVTLEIETSPGVWSAEWITGWQGGSGTRDFGVYYSAHRYGGKRVRLAIRPSRPITYGVALDYADVTPDR